MVIISSDTDITLDFLLSYLKKEAPRNNLTDLVKDGTINRFEINIRVRNVNILFVYVIGIFSQSARG